MGVGGGEAKFRFFQLSPHTPLLTLRILSQPSTDQASTLTWRHRETELVALSVYSYLVVF